MLSVANRQIMLSPVNLIVIILSVVMLNVVMLSVVILSVVMLSVAILYCYADCFTILWWYVKTSYVNLMIILEAEVP
jgi:hypothetical protein